MATLAVKYRPQTFDDVCGQTNIITILTHQLQTNQFKQVYLFTGPSGCGKTTMARLLAKQLNKETGSVIEIDAASNNGVDDVRTLIKDAKFLPLDGAYKVYILDEVHLFSAGAWGALLKLIEEPPTRTIFIFCTTDPQKIPNTILSRMQRYNFTRLTETQIITRLKHILKQEHIQTYDEAALQLLAHIAQGGMRDSIALLEKCLGFSEQLTVHSVTQALGVVGYDNLLQLLQGITKHDTLGVLKLLTELYQQGIDLKLLISDMIALLLNLIKYKLTQDYVMSELPNGYQTTVDALALEKEILISLVDDCVKLHNSIKYESNPIVFVEAFLCRLTK